MPWYSDEIFPYHIEQTNAHWSEDWRRTYSSIKEGIDWLKVSDHAYESELTWMPKRNSYAIRKWINSIPRNKRNHNLVCAYCRFGHEIDVQPKGRWRKGRSSAHRNYELSWRGETIKCTATVPYPISAWNFKETLRRYLRKPKVALIEANEYQPFDTLGLNLEAGDLVHCEVCPLSIFVEEVAGGRIACHADGKLKMRKVDLYRDSRTLWVKIFRLLRSGKIESAMQKDLEERFAKCFEETIGNG